MSEADFSHPLESVFLDTIEKFTLVNNNDKILIGLSGGADSTALADLFFRFQNDLKAELLALHIHHGLRPQSADRDAEFCRAFCEARDIPFELRHANVAQFAKENGISVEMAGRSLRYSFFDELAQRYQCDKIATAHHLDDQAETVLLRIFKGCGLDGLQGIRLKRGNIIRPLLRARKSEIVDYLKQRKITYVSDESNYIPDTDRNFLRNRVFPVIRERFPAAEIKLAELSVLANEERAALDEWAAEYEDQLEMTESGFVMEKACYADRPVIARRLIRRAIQSELDPDFIAGSDIFRILRAWVDQAEGNRLLYEGRLFRVFSAYDRFLFEKRVKNFQITEKYVKIEGYFQTEYGDYRLIFQPGDFAYDSKQEKNCCLIKCRGHAELKLRPREDGDRIEIADKRHKKLKDLLVDEKVAFPERNNVLVIEMDNRIAAVYIPGIGFRVSRDFYLSPDTSQKAIHIKLEKRGA